MSKRDYTDEDFWDADEMEDPRVEPTWGRIALVLAAIFVIGGLLKAAFS